MRPEITQTLFALNTGRGAISTYPDIKIEPRTTAPFSCQRCANSTWSFNVQETAETLLVDRER
jgi:hypothetical protein